MDFKKLFDKFLSNFSKSPKKDIGIDLGTANTVIYVKGEGILVNEPSYVSINNINGNIEFIGKEARSMYGRTATHSKVERPLRNGVISNYEVTAKMISKFMNNILEKNSNTRVIIGIPSGVTQVEKRAVVDAIKDTGATGIYLVEEPIAAAIGSSIDIFSNTASLIIDIGGGTTEIAFIVSGGAASTKSIKIAGDHMNADIIEYIKEKYRLYIGERTAEDLKISSNSIDKIEKYTIKGKEVGSGLPKSITVTNEDIEKAIFSRVSEIIYNIKVELENISPEISADIHDTGIYLSGGGANVMLLKKKIEEELNLEVHIANEPLLAVINGIAKIFDDFEKYRNIISDQS